MKSKVGCLLLAACLLLTLTGCKGKISGEKENLPDFPPMKINAQAPYGDIPVTEKKIYTVYLPGKNGLYLQPQHLTLGPASQHETLETLIRALLSYESNDQVDALGGGTELTLFGDHPVELCGGICTVNLGSSALQLSYRNFYILALALAETLCELDCVDSVNVLVAGQSVGLDITGGLAMGSVTPHPGENLPVLWEQMEARKTPLGGNLRETPLSARMAVYFPLDNGRGITCESRIVSFDGQTPQQMAIRILETMSGGSMYLTGMPEMPDIRSLLLHDPLASELADGGRLITLSFREDTPEILRRMKLDTACLMAAITWSLTTFIPGTAAISVRWGEQPVTQLNTEEFGQISVLGGLLRRDAFTAFLMGRTTVYFSRDGKLVSCEKPVRQDLADSPRKQLVALMEGPGSREMAEGLQATLPGAVGEDDILGVSAKGNMLLINLSEGFRSEIESLGAEKEMLLCYSMVNTLCENNGMRQVCFFFEGEQVETIAGEIFWAGVFDQNEGLIEPSFG